jgi:sugar-specific transcriptional regulator TrmB
MDTSQLEELGLTHNESLTYVALLEIGETSTGAIVKKTGLHRVLIYDALENLIKKGLVSFVIKENIKYFQATDPNRILDFLKEKEEIAKSILPELSLKMHTAKTQQQVSIYEGVKGLKSALQNMIHELTPGGTYYAFASGNMASVLGPYYNIYQKEKEKNKIKTMAIFDKEFKKRKDILKMTSATIKYYPLTYFPTDTLIYNDKVLIIMWTANPVFATLIVSKQAAQSYKKFFDVFWKNAKN